MRYSYAAISMIIVGMMTFVVLMVFQDVTINNEADYYSIKEAMEASMVESIDKNYYARTGELKIVEQKFVANFTRRFANNTMGSSKSYIIDFYDIMESPPKASIRIKNNTDLMIVDENSADIINNLTGILEATVDKSSYNKTVCNGNIITGSYSKTDYYSFLVKGSSMKYKLNSKYVLGKILSENKTLKKSDILNLRVSEIKDVNIVTSDEDIWVKFQELYKSKHDGGWIDFGENDKPQWRSGKNTEDNSCYTSNAIVKIIDAIGENDDTNDELIKFPVVRVESKSKCNKKSSGTLINYTVVWKYDYCG